MRRLNVEGIVYAGLKDCPALTAPLLLATRRERHGPIVERFRAELKQAARAL